jgi:hypothetical protein
MLRFRRQWKIGFYAEEIMARPDAMMTVRTLAGEEIWYPTTLRGCFVALEVDLSLPRKFTAYRRRLSYIRTVPMDGENYRRSGAASLRTAPRPAIAYAIGKLRIERMLAERRLQPGDASSTSASFTITSRSTGNVPLSCNAQVLGLDTTT